GLRLGDRVGASIAARAGAVLDDDLVPKIFAELLCQQAGGDIDRAAGRERIDDADDAIWIALCRRRCGQRQQTQHHDRKTTRNVSHLLCSSRRRSTLFHFANICQHAAGAAGTATRGRIAASPGWDHSNEISTRTIWLFIPLPPPAAEAAG